MVLVGAANVAIAAASSETSAREKGWVVDSGATTNVVNPRLVPGSRSMMDNYRPPNSPSSFVTVAGGTKLPATGYGNVNFVVTTATGKKVPMTLKDIFVVPYLGCCLFSTSAASRAGDSCIINQDASGKQFL